MSEALNVVACVEVNTKFFREENWHAVIGHTFNMLAKKLRPFGRRSPSTGQILEVLVQAGATCSPCSLAPVAAKGSYIRFLVYEDGSLGHEFLERVVKP